MQTISSIEALSFYVVAAIPAIVGLAVVVSMGRKAFAFARPEPVRRVYRALRVKWTRIEDYQ